jgi:hypothetical protein
LIPVLASFFYHRPKKIRPALLWLAAFSFPTLVSTYLWYNTFTEIGISSIFLHTDFFTQNPNPAPPTYFFATNFLVSYGLGWLFIDAVALSLLFCLVQRRALRSFLGFDAISVAVIVCVIGVNTWLGATLDLKAPFLNAFKYDYQALPFFCFLAASLISKSISMFKLSTIKINLAKRALTAAGLLGFMLLAATLYYNMHYAQMFSMWDYLIFKVEPSADAGYSLFNSAPIAQNSPLIAVQLTGFTVAISGMLWLGRHKLAPLKAHLPKKHQK